MTEWEWLMSGWALAYILGSFVVIVLSFWIIDQLDNRNKEHSRFWEDDEFWDEG